MKLLGALVVLAGLLAVVRADAGPLEGTWSGYLQDTQCTITMTFELLTFAAVEYGSGCLAPGSFMGTYATTADTVELVYALWSSTQPPPNQLVPYALNGSTVTLYLGAQIGDLTLTQQPVASNLFQGVWSETDLEPQIRAQFWPGMAFVVSQWTDGAWVYMVGFEPLTNLPVTQPMFYAYAPSQSSFPPNFEYTQTAFSQDLSGHAVLISSTNPQQPPEFAVSFTEQNPVTALDGTWQAVTSDPQDGNVQHTTIMTQGVFRSFVVPQNGPASGYVGAFNILNDTAIQMWYGWSQDPTINNTVRIFNYELKPASPVIPAVQLTLSGWVGPDPFSVTFFQVDAATATTAAATTASALVPPQQQPQLGVKLVDRHGNKKKAPPCRVTAATTK